MTKNRIIILRRLHVDVEYKTICFILLKIIIKPIKVIFFFCKILIHNIIVILGFWNFFTKFLFMFFKYYYILNTTMRNTFYLSSSFSSRIYFFFYFTIKFIEECSSRQKYNIKKQPSVLVY